MAQRARVRLLFLLFIFCGLILARRLYQIQALEGKNWAEQAVAQRTRVISLKEQRGEILDRRGRPLTGREDREIIVAVKDLYDQFLRGGEETEVTITVDGLSRPISGLGFRHKRASEEAPSGTGNPKVILEDIPKDAPSDLWLTLDLKVQEMAEEVLEEEKVEKGAVVILEARSGRILAMANQSLTALSTANNAPRVSANRAVKAYPPGSVFRLLVAAAAFEEGAVRNESLFMNAESFNSAGEEVYCPHCREGGDKALSFAQAMAYPCRSVLVGVGLQTGVDKILALAERFGWKEGGLGLVEEDTGLLSAAGDLDRKARIDLILGERGVVMVSPLQMAGVLQAVAADGIYHPPFVVEGLKSQDGRWRQKPSSPPARRVFSSDTAASLRQLLLASPLKGDGEQKVLQEEVVITGVAEAGDKGSHGGSRSHGWSIGYLSVHSPHLVIAVFIEGALNAHDRASVVFDELRKRL